MGARAVVVLVLLAALLGAPPRASAAANQLLDPAAGPASGGITTVFSFRVRYEGSFAAVAITTTVAGLTLPMLRTAGTESSGTWTAASVLPAGTWQPAFTAVAAQGNQPTVLGPSVVVTAPAPTAAPGEVAPTPGGPAPGPTGRSVPIGEGTAPTATPAPAAPVATVAPVVGATPTVGPTQPAAGSIKPGAVPDGPGPSAGSTSAGAITTGGDADPGAGQVLPGATPSSAAARAAVSTGPTPAGSRGPGGSAPSGLGMPSGLDGGTGTTSQVGTVLVIGLSGVATVALVGLAVLLARRRREENGTVTEAATDHLPEAVTVARRPSHGARIDLPDDPIVAALGLGRNEPRTRNQRNRRPD